MDLGMKKSTNHTDDTRVSDIHEAIATKKIKDNWIQGSKIATKGIYIHLIKNTDNGARGVLNRENIK
jgi:hypothetical protein